ncbi:Zinc knuckle CX2CX4HX4C [Sesbania bispinosa]|nr:Zinc knuckle CX2CX4HX4C [Sesbania bispinosa]
MEPLQVEAQRNVAMEGEEIELDMSEEASKEAVARAKTTLVGRIVADKALNRNVVKDIVTKAWNMQEDLKIADMGPNTYLFTFARVDQVKRILEEGPGFIMGHLMSLQCWIPEGSALEINFDFVKFWIQLHGLPLEFMNVKNACKIAQKIGSVISVEDPFVEGQLLRPFFKVKVEVNIKKPLLTGFSIPRKDLPRTWVFIKYERLQDFCYNCGVLGHDFWKCKEEKAMAIHIPNRPRYGPGLAVLQAKAMSTIVSENINRVRRMRKEEDDDVAHKDKARGQESAASTTATGEVAQQRGETCQSADIPEQIVETNPAPPATVSYNLMTQQTMLLPPYPI